MVCTSNEEIDGRGMGWGRDWLAKSMAEEVSQSLCLDG